VLVAAEQLEMKVAAAVGGLAALCASAATAAVLVAAEQLEVKVRVSVVGPGGGP
jgi:diaminopimelate epimerase